jgi:dolichol-phosphate mannosyltransferase
MKALVVVPTYDERANLERLVRSVLAQDPGLHVLVVDDASPDGTGRLADELAREEPRVRVLHRPAKRGLGTAYVDGFRHALRETDAACVLQMDADLSHDPAALGSFLRAIEDCDVVVGSRYRDGVRVVDWPLERLLISALANVYARLVTGVPVYDLTSGFKCYRRSALERIPLERIRSDGYAFQIEIVTRAFRRGLRVREIPIVFTERADGRSKLSWRIAWEAAWIVWWLRLTSGRDRLEARSAAAGAPAPDGEAH